MNNILNEVQSSNPDLCAEIRTMMSGGVLAPSANIPEYAWNSDRLNEYLNGMDGALLPEITNGPLRWLTHAWRGFSARSFGRNPRDGRPIQALSKEVCDHLKSVNKEYPDKVLNLIKHSSHAVDRARNRFSESHFGGEAGLWLATYMRDLVNTQIRLLSPGSRGRKETAREFVTLNVTKSDLGALNIQFAFKEKNNHEQEKSALSRNS